MVPKSNYMQFETTAGCSPTVIIQRGTEPVFPMFYDSQSTFRPGELVWQPPGRIVEIAGTELESCGYYIQDTEPDSSYPFAVNPRHTVNWALPRMPAQAADWRLMSPEHRGCHLNWLRLRKAVLVPHHSREAYIETWVYGLEWHLLEERQYDPPLLQEIERVVRENRACIGGSPVERSMAELLFFAQFLHNRQGFPSFWERLIPDRVFPFPPLARKLVLADLCEREIPLGVEIAERLAEAKSTEAPSASSPRNPRIFQEQFKERYPTGWLLEPASSTHLRYVSHYVGFEERASSIHGGVLVNELGEVEQLLNQWWAGAASPKAWRSGIRNKKREDRVPPTEWFKDPELQPVSGKRPAMIVNERLLEAVQQETLKVRDLLVPILALEEEACDVSAGNQVTTGISWAASLEPRLVPVLEQLIAKSEWSASEFDAICRKYHLSGVAVRDSVNAWADEAFGDFLFEGDHPTRLNKPILKNLLKTESEAA